jgi:hypothetical protein
VVPPTSIEELRRRPVNPTTFVLSWTDGQWANDVLCRYRDGSAFTQAPWWSPLLFENESSDARDHCANERSTQIAFPLCKYPHRRHHRAFLPLRMDTRLTAKTAFLSYLRLSVYMSVVSIAIILSFHLKDEPSDFELQMALPLGIVFWCLGLLCLALGFGNYVKTVTKYSRRTALVQTGWKTQTVSRRRFGSYRGGTDG